MKKKKFAVFAGFVVLIAAVGGAGYYFRDTLREAIPFLRQGNPDDKVYVQKVSRLMNQNTGVANRYNGIVETQETYEVNVDSSRTIEEILVKVGDTVEEGQALVVYDTSDIDLQIRQAELEKEGINNEIANYNRQIEALKKERDAADESDKFSYTTEIQSLENSIEQTRFDLDSKQLEIDKYREQLTKSTVVSKQSGVVKEINENGMNSSGDSAAFMTILKAGDYRVKGKIDEQTVWMVSEGQPVVVRSRVEDRIWRGTISKVDTGNISSGDNDNEYGGSDNSESTTKYPFYIELDSVDGLLLGQHVYIEMDEGQEQEKEGLWLFASYIVIEGDEPDGMEGITDTEGGLSDAWGTEAPGMEGIPDLEGIADTEFSDRSGKAAGIMQGAPESAEGGALAPEAAEEGLESIGGTELPGDTWPDASGRADGIVDNGPKEGYVWVANEKNRLEKRVVTLGKYDANLDEYEILSGLTGDDYIAWPMPGLYEGITTVTDMEEVDYTSPLYNQESTESGDLMWGNEGVEPDFWNTEMEFDDLYDAYDSEAGVEGLYDTEVDK